MSESQQVSVPGLAADHLRGEPGAVVNIQDIPIFDGDQNDAVDLCLDLIRTGRGGRVATANLDFFALAKRDVNLRDDLRASTLVVADGMPVVWLSKIAGGQRIERTAGVDLVREICSRGGAEQELRVAIYGSTPEVGRAAAAFLEGLADGVAVVARIAPPFRKLTAAESESFGQQLAAAAPNLVLVALGCPAQERLIATSYDLIPSALWIGVGGTFDFFAGRRKRAPGWAQRTGIEWLVRMAQDPKRLGRRYLLRDLPALVRLVPGCLRAGLLARRSAVRS